MVLILELLFIIGAQPAQRKIHKSINCHSLRFLRGGQLGAGFTEDAEIAHQTEEAEVVAGLVRVAVRENASTAQSQEEYMRTYDSLCNRYEAATAELNWLKAERDARQRQDKDIALFTLTQKKQPVVLDKGDDIIWTVMVEKGIVRRDGEITFVFYNGTEITVGAE